MIGQSDDAPSRENFTARVFDGLPGALVNDSEDILKTRPLASAVVQPVSSSATGFISRTKPCASVAITASPMLLRATCNHSPRATANCRARWSDSLSAATIAPTMRKTIRPSQASASSKDACNEYRGGIKNQLAAMQTEHYGEETWPQPPQPSGGHDGGEVRNVRQRIAEPGVEQRSR